ncbi:MAG TPA: hypothetical protein VHT49_15070 [Acidimicrobiales bacterium]|nr:hypothetical protein [Acidimicrobiales bacterium]
MRRTTGKKVAARLVAATGLCLAVIGGPAVAGADSGTTSPANSLVGYSATTQAVGAQFAFNVPGVVPLPNQNLIEEDVPFSRVNVAGGPVVDSLSAPFYPGDIAANLGSLLATFGFPGVLPNDPFLAEAKFPTSPGFPAQSSFGGTPAPGSAPLAPSIFSAISHAAVGGGDASAAISDLSIDPLGNKLSLPLLNGIISGASNLLDVANVSASNAVSVNTSTVKATSTAMMKALNIAGMVDISGLTATATCTSDGTKATPTASLTLGQVTVDGMKAYIDGTGVHIAATSTGTLGLTPAALQKTLNATLAQDGISIRVLDPVLTTNGAVGSANAGGLSVALTHQFDVPFIPGEPTIPVPELGNVGLPAGLYTMTTSITFGMAQVDVSATGIPAVAGGLPSAGVAAGTPDTSSFDNGSGTGLTTFGGTPGTVQNLPSTGPGSATANPTPTPTSATAFPIRGIPAPLGWIVTALLACVLLAYPLLLLARWQFLAGRRP